MSFLSWSETLQRSPKSRFYPGFPLRSDAHARANLNMKFALLFVALLAFTVKAQDDFDDFENDEVSLVT